MMSKMSELEAEAIPQQPNLRDMIAMAALPSYINRIGIEHEERVIDAVYEFADMMLSAKKCDEGNRNGTEKP
jgi:hypothetical protein